MLTGKEREEAEQRIDGASVVAFVGWDHGQDVAEWCGEFLERTEFWPVPLADDWGLFLFSTDESQRSGFLAVMAHGLHENHVMALQEQLERHPRRNAWEVWVPTEDEAARELLPVSA